MGGEHLRLLPSSGLSGFLLAGARPAGSHPLPFRWYGGSKFHLTVGDGQVSISVPTAASLFDGTSSSPASQSSPMQRQPSPGGWMEGLEGVEGNWV